MPRFVFAVPFLLAVAAWSAASHAQTETRDAASLKFETGFAGPPASTWPADAPPLRFYFGPGATAPGCGLMATSKEQIVPLVEPDDGAHFPQCIAVPAAMVLQHGNQRFFLLRVKQKDTREDSSVNDMLLLDRDGVPQLRDDLSFTAVPDATKPLTQVAAWLRARWANQAETEHGARALPEHTATTPGAYLAIAQLPDGQCQFSVGTPDRTALLLKANHLCDRVAATSAFQQGAESWFVVLLGSGAAGAEALVFEADSKGAREVPEMATELQAKAIEGKILPLRQALEKLVASAKS